MAGRLAGRTALITGGGSGIGRACAVRFAQEGAAVCVADLNMEGAAETARAVRALGGHATELSVDTTDAIQNERMVEHCEHVLGGVDVLIAAAGINRAPAQRVAAASAPFDVLTLPLDAFKQILEVNFWGVYHADKAVARWLLAQGQPGTIINLASIMSRMPDPAGAYSISKAPVWMLTKTLAKTLAPHNIRVNAIGPGFIETPMTAPLRDDEAWSRDALALTWMGRFGRPEEIANTALFLASDEASYFTGELLHPAGGMFLG